jgi:hypothetical protein
MRVVIVVITVVMRVVIVVMRVVIVVIDRGQIARGRFVPVLKNGGSPPDLAPNP